MAVNAAGLFPVTLITPEETTHYHTVSDLETDVEFLSTDDPEFNFRDAQGRTLRVRVWALELGLLQGWSGEGERLEIWSALKDGDVGLAEVRASDKTVLRTVLQELAWPHRWDDNQPGIHTPELLNRSDMSVSDFNELWMRARFRNYS